MFFLKPVNELHLLILLYQKRAAFATLFRQAAAAQIYVTHISAPQYFCSGKIGKGEAKKSIPLKVMLSHHATSSDG